MFTFLGGTHESAFSQPQAYVALLGAGTVYRQGYLSSMKERTVRVRTIGDKGYLTVKGITTGATRSEFEYEIPAADTDAMLSDLCEKPLIEKNRYKVRAGGNVMAEFTYENMSPQWVGAGVVGPQPVELAGVAQKGSLFQVCHGAVVDPGMGRKISIRHQGCQVHVVVAPKAARVHPKQGHYPDCKA